MLYEIGKKRLEVDGDRVTQEIIFPCVAIKCKETGFDSFDSRNAGFFQAFIINKEGAVSFLATVDMGRHTCVHRISVYGSFSRLNNDIKIGIVFNAEGKLRANRTTGSMKAADENDFYTILVNKNSFRLFDSRVCFRIGIGRNGRCRS